MAGPRIGDTITTNDGKVFTVVERGDDLDLLCEEVSNPKRKRIFKEHNLTCIDYDDGIYGEF